MDRMHRFPETSIVQGAEFPINKQFLTTRQGSEMASQHSGYKLGSIVMTCHNTNQGFTFQ